MHYQTPLHHKRTVLVDFVRVPGPVVHARENGQKIELVVGLDPNKACIPALHGFRIDEVVIVRLYEGSTN